MTDQASGGASATRLVIRPLAPILTKRRGCCSWRRGEPVAQSVEHETFNLGVVGSIPTGLTNLASGSVRLPFGFLYERASIATRLTIATMKR